MNASDAAKATLQTDGAGRFKLIGTLDFITVPQLLLESDKLFAKERQIRIDLTDVTDSNSAGLALLLEWMRRARLQNATVSFSGIPKNMLSVAEVTELEGLIPQGPSE